MKNHHCFCAIVALSMFFLPSQNVSMREILDSTKIEEMKRSESIRSSQQLPKWLAELPDTIPAWMKRAASKYRGAPHQILCAMVKMAKALNDMKAAKARNCDNYFRCRGSFDAAKCGVYAAAFANNIRYNFSPFLFEITVL